MKRLPAFLVLLLVALVPAPTRSQEAADTVLVDSLLALSEVEDVLGTQAVALANQLRRTAELTPQDWARLEPVLQSELSFDALYRDLADHLLANAPEGRIADALALLDGGANAEIDSLDAAFTPPQSMEEFVDELASSPPDPVRMELMVRWAEAQSAGDFYVVLSEAVRRSAHGVAEALTSVPGYEPMDEARYLALRRQAFNGAVISFLYRFQEVPDDLIRRAIEQYESEAAAWFVEAYTLGIAQAVLDAGERVRDRLTEG